MAKKRCSTCKKIQPASEFYARRLSCKSCVKAQAKQWRQDNPERFNESHRNSRLKRKFGISAKTYADMLAAQGGVCAVCAKPCATGRRLAVDHCHDSGRVRGLLCNGCNRSIGLVERFWIEVHEYLGRA